MQKPIVIRTSRLLVFFMRAKTQTTTKTFTSSRNQVPVLIMPRINYATMRVLTSFALHVYFL
jgi:hypothetical protein